jgi:hypothetical protein
MENKADPWLSLLPGSDSDALKSGVAEKRE